MENRKNSKERPFAVADLETDPFKHGLLVQPFCAGFYDGKNLQILWGSDCIQRLLALCIKFPGIVYFHNGGKFDLHFLFAHADAEQFSDCVTIGSRIVKLKYGACEFRDSFALIPKPLASWEKDKIDYRKFLKHRREANKNEIIDYLKTDLRALYQMLEEFFLRYGRQLTLASATVSILSKDYGIKIPKLTERDDRWFRRWYFAGRVQFWGLGRHTGKYTIYDINSAFPRAMTEKHWFCSEWRESSRIPKKNKEQAFYLVECEAGGAIPQRQKDNSISFPMEQGKYFVTGWELFTGLKLGRIKNCKIVWIWIPKKLGDYQKYVENFYRMKSEAKNKADIYFAKILLNALYGKTGSNPRNYRDVCIRPFRKQPLGKNGKEDMTWQVGHDDRERGLTFYERPTELKASSFYNVCIAASITGYVRAYLFEAICRCSPLYCDTDSLICKKSPGDIGTGLGQWKKEMNCDVVWIGGKKLYVAHDAKFPWLKKPGRDAEVMSAGKWYDKDWVWIKDLGWTRRESFKTASKGVRLPVEDLIAVCEGRTRTGKFLAPSYSIFRDTTFTKRTIRRADKRK